MKSLAVFFVGFAVRAAILLWNPVVWGGDTIIRLFDRFTLVKAHQLPMLQVLIAGVSYLTMNPAAVQYMVALVGAAAGVGFYWLIRDLFDEPRAFLAALLFATHPYFVAVSTVPFQEILMLAGLVFAFHFFYTGRWLAASACLALACFTRFEAWLAGPVLAAAYFWRKERNAAGAVKAALMFGWAPAAWILYEHGLTSSGHFVVDRTLSIWRLQRYVYLGWITLKFTQLPVLLLAAAGAWRLDRSDWRIRVQIAFLALFLLAIPFSAHGVMPDPERYVTSREAFIPMFFVLLLAACGLGQARRPVPPALWPRWNRLLTAAGMVLGVAGAIWYVHIQTSDPEVALDYQVARYLDRNVGQDERVLLLTPPISEETTQLYLTKVKQTGGARDMEEAEREMQAMAATPPDYQRVAVYSKLGRERLISRADVETEWIAVWAGGQAGVLSYSDAELVGQVGNLPHSVTVWRRRRR